MNGILSQKWAISYEYAERALALYLRSIGTDHNLIRKQSLEELSKSYASASWDGQIGVAFAEGRKGRVAIIPMIGPLTKYGDLCSIGMQEYGAILSRIESSPEYEGIVLVMDTPGGTVDGTPELGNTISSMTKPVVVFGDGVVASAGVWLASQADYIIGNKNNPTEFGSIGVLLALPNIQNMVDVGNHPAIEIYRATKSSEKARINMVEKPDEASRQYIQDSLDETNSDFIATVKTGRGDRLNAKADGLFSGRMFSSKEAKTIGLIDSIGTLSDAINKVSTLAKTPRAKASGASASEQQLNESEDMKISQMLLDAVNSLRAAISQPAPEATEEQLPAETTPTDPVDEATPEAVPAEQNVQAEVASIHAEIESIRTDALSTITQLREQNQVLSQQVSELTEQLSKFQTSGAPKSGGTQFRTEGASSNRVKEWAEKQKQTSKR